MWDKSLQVLNLERILVKIFKLENQIYYRLHLRDRHSTDFSLHNKLCRLDLTTGDSGRGSCLERWERLIERSKYFTLTILWTDSVTKHLRILITREGQEKLILKENHTQCYKYVVSKRTTTQWIYSTLV